MVRLILVRHGQTRSNVHGLLDTGFPGPGLTDLGREQAAALVERLADERVERIVASPLVRTVETAAPLAAALGLDVPTDTGLREVMAGDIELRGDRASVLTYLDAVFAWSAGDLTARLPGNPESGRDFFSRYDAAVESAVAGAVGAVVCVSHGAAIRTWAGGRAVNLTPLHGTERGLPNTGIVVLERQPGGPWQAVGWEQQRFDVLGTDPAGAPVEG